MVRGIPQLVQYVLVDKPLDVFVTATGPDINT